MCLGTRKTETMDVAQAHESQRQESGKIVSDAPLDLEPLPADGAGKAEMMGCAPIESSVLVKTKLCKFFAKGECARGEGCTYAHGRTQLRAQPDFWRTQLCFDYEKTGTCVYGVGCRYAHSDTEIRPSGRTKAERLAEKRQLRREQQAASRNQRLTKNEATLHQRLQQLEVNTEFFQADDDLTNSSNSRTNSSGPSSKASGEKQDPKSPIFVKNTFIHIAEPQASNHRRNSSVPRWLRKTDIRP